MMCINEAFAVVGIIIIILNDQHDQTLMWDIIINTMECLQLLSTAINIIPSMLNSKRRLRCNSSIQRDRSRASTSTKRLIRMEIIEKLAIISTRFKIATAAAKL